MTRPLLTPVIVAVIERAASAHRGRPWRAQGGVHDDGIAERRELWRIFGYLAVIAACGQNPLGRQFTNRLAGTLRRYAAT